MTNKTPNNPTDEPISVCFRMLSESPSTERDAMEGVRDELVKRGVVEVDDWRDADIYHLFEDFILTRDSLHPRRLLEVVRAARSTTPVVLTTDDLYFIDRPDLTVHPRLYPLHAATNRWLLRRADAAVAYSHSVRRAFAQHTDPKKLDVGYLAADETFSEHTGMQRESDLTFTVPDEPFVLHVSLAAKRKNPAAIREVARRIESPFVVAGTGWDEYLSVESRRENVHALGFISGEELSELYRRAAVFYFPTLHEGFGYPVLEAMQSGTSVVTTDAYSVPEVAGDAAYLCSPDNVDEHLACIERLIDDPEHRSSFEQAGLERSKQFSWARCADETLRVYHRVV